MQGDVPPVHNGGSDAVTRTARCKPIQGIPRLSKPIQAILGKKRLFIFFGRKVMQGKGGGPPGPARSFGEVAVTQSPLREERSHLFNWITPFGAGGKYAGR
jgi:hypothetical protein